MSKLYEKLNIAILGFGTVGRGVYDIINKHDTSYTKRLNIRKILVRDKKKAEFCGDDLFTDRIDEIISDNKINLVVECIGGINPSYEYVKKCLDTEKLVVTSNKMLLATKYNALVKKYGKQLRYEASVCGGLHVFHAIESIKKVDNIVSFRGIINGTTNFILSKIASDNCSFEDALKTAQQYGFAETDPSSDIEGLDAFYKAVLLHNIIFDDNIEITDKLIEKYKNNKDLVGIQDVSYDDVLSAKKNNKTIKLVAYGDKNNIYIRPIEIDNSDYISHVNGNANCLVIESDNLGKSSYVGAGAGKFPTAHAVVLDVSDFLV